MLRLDSHVDTLWQLSKQSLPDLDLSKDRDDLQVTVPKLQAGGISSVWFALYQRDPQVLELREVRQRLLRQIKIYHELNGTNLPFLSSVTPRGVQQAYDEDRIATSLGLENGYALGYELEWIQKYKDLGVHYITLCHNVDNQICWSSTGTSGQGLSFFGREVIKEMNRLGMMIDVSHASDQTVWDVLQITTKPIIASHSCSRERNPSVRNLSDALLREIKFNKGVVQLTLLPRCVGGDHDVQSFTDHVEHIWTLIGGDHIGFGSDFDGGGGLTDLRDASQVFRIEEEFLRRGFKAEELERFWGSNFLRVWTQNLQN